ncbi:acyl-CoA dehydrogenase family protein [Streptomyces sp. NBC_00878]|uniref:acyl-CoA dehydrogenase family protein n=1 Tax=Streptomyces sp. NBC_00878 TaxID=2975854 RepID=UPI00224D3794|nr:acyl-CoA dehydrogenase family protein [Streptomyces sp. NBC_00878]MCX4906885.1 acyl-CoA dehydrogenase family protein [Streptomyces sp. NBC_00878]
MPQHPLSANGLRATARDALQVAAAYAAQADTDRRLAPEPVKALLAAGFARHFVPERRGGQEGGFTELLDAVSVLAEGCTSTAWIASLGAQVGRMAAFLPEEGGGAVWREGPDTLLVGGLVPSGSATATDGGWLLDGAWPYVSGVDFSDWALLCGRVPGVGGGELRFFAVPRSTYRIKETWDSVGMRATGSHTLVVEGAVVPAHLSFPYDDLLRGSDRGGRCYRVPHRAVNGLSFVAPVLGAARGLLRRWTDWEAPQPEVVRAGAEIDAAQLLLERTAAAADAGEYSPLLTARATRDCAVAAELLATATGRLFRAHGTRGQSEAHPAQRVWRDVSTATTHAVLRFPTAATAFGAAAHAAREA